MTADLDYMRERRANAYAESCRLRAELRAYPLDSVAPYLPDGRLSCRNLRNATNVGWRSAQTWVRAGHVNEPAADLIATRLGVHPSTIWPEWFAA